MDNCLNNAASEAIEEVSLHGGYSELREPFFRSWMFNTSFWYYQGEENIPDKQTIERELASETEKGVLSCIEDFRSFEGLDIKYDEPTAEVMITEESVLFNLDFPITINSGKTEKISRFTEEKTSSLSKALSTAANIVEKEELSYPYTDLTLMTVSNYNITVSDLGLGDKVYYLTRINPLEDKEEIFIFAMRFEDV